MAVTPTVTLGYETTEGGGTYQNVNTLYPISARWGFTSFNPGMMNTAQGGEMTFFLDNSSSDLPWSEASTDLRGAGVGDNWRLTVTYGTDFNRFTGRVAEWYPFPGLADERVTQLTCRDYLYDAMVYNIDQLSPYANLQIEGVPLTSPGLLQYLFPDSDYLSSDIAVMPYRSPFYDYSTSGEVFTVAFHDLQDGQTPVWTALDRLATSEWARAYQEGGFLRYKTNDDFINLGGTNLGTLDNQFVDMDVSKTRGLEYAPIFVSYNPSEVSDSNDVLFTHPTDFTVKPGATKSIRVNYRDPNNKGVRVAVIDTDIVTPVDATDYVYTGVASSDLSVTLTNYGSAGLYSITNNGTANAAFTTLQVRGKPIFLYDRITLATTSGNPSAKALRVDLKYQDGETTAQGVLDYLDRTYGSYPLDNVVQHISFVPTVDSDAMTMAAAARIGNLVTIVEDVNGINEDYKIISMQWDILSFQNMIVTWGVVPNNYFSLLMTDSNGDYFTDSNGLHFAFWH